MPKKSRKTGKKSAKFKAVPKLYPQNRKLLWIVGGLLLLGILIVLLWPRHPQTKTVAPNKGGSKPQTSTTATPPLPTKGDKLAPSAPPQKVTGVIREDGAELLYRPAGASSAQNPAFSPDGNTLLFTLFHDGYNKGAAELFTMPLDSMHKAAPLISDADRANVNLPGASWNGSTQRVSFASDRAEKEEIWTMPAAGGTPTQVTHHESDSSFLEPSFSPDGAWLVFEEDTGREGDQISSIWKVRADGSELTKLIDAQATNTDNRQPNWSPKGDRIVFQRRNQGNDTWRLFTIAPDGGNLRQVTNGASDTDAAWSPDGQQLVYSSNYGGLQEANVFVISADGGTPRRVTTNSGGYDGAPSWSPDGAWIAFESYGGSGQEAPASLWRIVVPR